jgi:hypothetical protein
MVTCVVLKMLFHALMKVAVSSVEEAEILSKFQFTPNPYNAVLQLVKQPLWSGLLSSIRKPNSSCSFFTLPAQVTA